MRTRGKGIIALAMALAAGALAAGCGASAARAEAVSGGAYWGGASAGAASADEDVSAEYRVPNGERFTVSVEERASVPLTPASTGNSRREESTVEIDRLLDQGNAPEAPAPTQYAQASPESEEPTASDATSQALLVYTARLTMAVHEVSQNQERVIEIARSLGGHLSVRTDETVEIRVPARSFDDAMRQIQELGDVTSRNVEVQDVSEEFRDLETRIHTLEVMRARVEQLLQQAQGVEAALAVEQHLERITVELERLRGRVRYLADRVAFSTITVRFGARTDQTAPAFRLPFTWLQYLGLDSLMSL